MKNILLMLLVAVSLFSCKDDNKEPSSKCIDGYDQSVLLGHLKNDIIIPSYQDHQSKLSTLNSAINNLAATPSIANLQKAKTAFKASFLAFQAVAQYNFGPAETVDYRASLDNFPADIALINANINNEKYDFSTEGTFDKGYPALDYLLYADSEEDVVNKISTDAKFKKYLTGVITDMTSKTKTVLDSWNGEYGNTFTSNVGTSAGSSLSEVINMWNENYEITKRDRIAVPAGILSVGATFPKNVEAYYSGLSLELIKASINASENLYLGGNGQGLDDILTHIDAPVTYQNETKVLNTVIKDQYTLIKTEVNKITDPLSEAVDTDNTDIVSAYRAISQMVKFTKTDLPTAMCISITYVENPSDSD